MDIGKKESRILTYVAWTLVAISAMILLAKVWSRMTGNPLSVFDDAFMFIRYANNLVATGSYGWNAGEISYGCTSILYTSWFWLWQSLLHLPATSTSIMLMGSSIAFGVLALWLLAKVLRTLAPGFPQPWLWLLPLICSQMFQANILNGMDTTLTMAALVLMILSWARYSQRPGTNALTLAVIASYLPFLTRPDTGFFVLLFPVLWLWANEQLKAILPTVLALGGLLLMDVLIKFWYFGDPLPIPYYAKSGDLLLGYLGMEEWPVEQYLLSFLLIGAPSVVVVILSGERISWKVLLAFYAPMMLTLLVLSLKIQIMGYNARFFLPSIPFLILGPLASIPRKKMALPPRTPWLLLCWSAMALTGIFIGEFHERRVEREEAEADAVMAAHHPNEDSLANQNLLYQILDLLPAGATFAATEHGYLSVKYPDLNIFDLAGLHDVRIAKTGYRDSLLREVAPQVIWMPHSDYVGLREAMKSGAFFQQAYLFLPGEYEYGLAIYLAGPSTEAIKQVLDRRGLLLP
ncbi:MAG: hypothetical protein NWR72_20500 [Bacteroidia bacterium]|nr:hypothetical protein [Bacteroidia bacterium]